MHYLNRFQPVRPDGQFRTYPILTKKRIYQTTDRLSMIAQMQLYRWSRSFEFQRMVGSTDLHQYLFVQESIDVRIHVMGATVLNAVDFDPRKMKWVEGVALWMYVFPSAETLSFGLEYMICTWLRKFLNLQDFDGNLEDELDILANTEEREYRALYLNPIRELGFSKPFNEPDWLELTKDIEPTKSMTISSSEMKRDKPPLRDLSQYGRRGR